MIQKLIKKRFRNFTPYSSARSLYSSGTFMDANENPFDTGLNRYPLPEYPELKNAISGYTKLPVKNIFVGSGSDEIIDLTIRLFVEPDEQIAICTPTYGMYEVAANINGIGVTKIPLTSEFQINTMQILKQITARTKLIFLCSPNNPTGNLLNRSDIEIILNNFTGVVVIDEAYFEFAEISSADLLNKYPLLIILRTLSKAWGLAGARLGFALAAEVIITYLNMIKAPYNISTLTERAAIKALKNPQKMRKQVTRILYQKKILVKKLSDLNLEVYPSDTNFVLIKMKDASKIVAKIYGVSRIVTRAFRDSIRITIGTASQNKALLRSLTKIL